MKRILALAVLSVFTLTGARAQQSVTYSLPQTSVHLKVTAEK